MSNHTIAAPITTWAEARTTDREVLNRAEVAALLTVDAVTGAERVEKLGQGRLGQGHRWVSFSASLGRFTPKIPPMTAYFTPPRRTSNPHHPTGRTFGGRLGNGKAAAGEAANAVSRLKALRPETVVEPRMLRGFQALFRRIDSRITDILESGVERGAFVQRVTVPRLVSGDGRLVHPVRERFVPVSRAADLEVIRTAREHLRPQEESSVSPGASRADLHAALIHRPPAKGAQSDVPGL